MVTFEQARGTIFDLDDTLLDNGPADKPAEWLHSRSRLAAIHAIALRKNILHESILRKFGVGIPDASSFIRSLALYGLSQRLSLATSAVKRDIDIFLDKYRLKNYFPNKQIISAEKVTHPKPDPECFELAFQSLSLSDSDRPRVWAFEDNPRGIKSAKAVGLFVCAITTRFKRADSALIAAKPDLIADSFQEFAQLLHVPLAH